MVDLGEDLFALGAETAGGTGETAVAGNLFNFATAGVGQHGTAVVAVTGADMTGHLIVILVKHAEGSFLRNCSLI